ncbi:MAG TPA: putative N-acetylmannosamine-6-phosphate 2-epimerase [Edaphobacter sp.]|nr:putative N-acetylmannosamine-6-phosphate 2-epimerase [Edaphobacter sp.]
MNLAMMNQIKGKLVVSCQAFPGDPLDDTDTLRRIARVAVANGAAGLRLNGYDHIAAIRSDTTLPIIGIQKKYVDGVLRITPDFESAAELASAGASIIALDCTNRTWNFGEPWQQIVERIHRELNLLVMADIATLEEGIVAAAGGADMIGMTLHGYTEETKGSHGFNWPLLASLVEKTGKPIIAEGHISTPAEARRAIDQGAWSVVVGSAITRPGVITSRFVQQIQRRSHIESAIGVDIGGTSIKAGFVNRKGNVSLISQVPTQAAEGRDAIASAAAQTIENVMTAASKEGLRPDGLGIASAGAIDACNGTVFAATDNLPGWAGFDLRGFAEDRFHLPTRVENDAHAAVLAELHFGLGRELSDFVAITIGTGVGGGIVSGGKLLRGQHGFAGTIGHHTIRFDGRPCNCGRCGCLEAYVSTAALIREYTGEEDAGHNGIPYATLALKISRLAAAGDAAALKAYSALACYLAEGVANIFNIIDPQAVILSGGLIEGHRNFADEVQQRVASILHFGNKRKPSVLLSSAGQYAGVQGAAASVFESSEK